MYVKMIYNLSAKCYQQKGKGKEKQNKVTKSGNMVMKDIKVFLNMKTMVH